MACSVFNHLTPIPKVMRLLFAVIISLALLIPAATPLSSEGELTITTSSLDVGTAGTAYSKNLTATGGTSPYTWEIIDGNLPAGLSLSDNTISGTPTTAGTSDFIVEVTDSSEPAATATRSLSITIHSAVSISTSVLQFGASGMYYNQTLAATGGSGSYAWSMTSGTLPPGLSMSSNKILGKPTKAGSYQFTVRASDNNTSADRTLVINIKESGYLYTWGDNSKGQLGNNSTVDRGIPVLSQKLEDSMVCAASGGLHSLAVDVNGNAWAWGNNSKGQLGIGSLTDKTTPEKLGDIVGIMGVAAGYSHSLALDEYGNVWSWGDNTHGQLGIGSTVAKRTPVEVWELEDIVSISAGYDYSLALKSDGTVWAWGHNDKGQLGDGSTTTRRSPVQVKGVGGSGHLNDVIAISAGYYHALALKADGTLAAWGDNSKGQLGNNSSTASFKNPVAVSSLEDISAIAAGGLHSLAAGTNGLIWAWGDNSKGQLGIDSTSNKRVPTQADRIDQITSVAAGHYHSIVMDDYGYVWAWGDNSKGQLGIDSTSNKRVPTQVVSFDGEVLFVAANAYNSLAISSEEIEIEEELTITTSSLSNGKIGSSYSQTLAATGGSGSYNWSRSSGSIPPGLSLNSSTGRISGTPTEAGDFTFKIKVNDNNSSLTASASFTIFVDTGETLSSVKTSGFNSSGTIEVDDEGYTQGSYRIITLDDKATISIPRGAQMLDSKDNPISTLSAAISSTPPEPPAGVMVITAYDFGPDGAYFNPALTITFEFDASSLPTGIDINTLYLAFYDGSRWQALDSTLDINSSTITGEISHFSTYAILGKAAGSSPSPTPTSAPAPSTPGDQEKPSSASSWPLIVGIIIFVILVGLVLFWLRLRRRTQFH